jgi:hypothetical protein
VLGLAMPIRRRATAQRAPFALLAAFPLFGAALALCLFTLGDALLRAAGNAAHGWLLVVPLGIAGAGSGRLWADALPADERAARRRLHLALAAGVVWIGIMAVASSR